MARGSSHATWHLVVWYRPFGVDRAPPPPSTIQASLHTGNGSVVQWIREQSRWHVTKSTKTSTTTSTVTSTSRTVQIPSRQQHGKWHEQSKYPFLALFHLTWRFLSAHIIARRTRSFLRPFYIKLYKVYSGFMMRGLLFILKEDTETLMFFYY